MQGLGNKANKTDLGDNWDTRACGLFYDFAKVTLYSEQILMIKKVHVGF